MLAKASLTKLSKRKTDNLKPRACSQCGDWYNPKFQGTESLCGKCHLKEVIGKQKTEVEVDKQKVKTSTSVSQPQTNHRPEPKLRVGGSEFRGECSKCGLWLEGTEVYNQERGWVYSWIHVDYDRTRRNYCLVA